MLWHIPQCTALPASPAKHDLVQNVSGAKAEKPCLNPPDKKLQQRTCYLQQVKHIRITISLTLNTSVALSSTPHSTPSLFYNILFAVSPDGHSSVTLMAEFNFMTLYNEWYMHNNWLIKLPPWSLVSLVGIQSGYLQLQFFLKSFLHHVVWCLFISIHVCHVTVSSVLKGRLARSL